MVTVNISETASISSSVVFGPNCEVITIGHACQVRANTYIDVRELTIGDYVTINPGSTLHGETVSIGHNCWVGQYSILDGHGGLLSLGNNVGVGAHSQLWSHMKFGDVLEGCRWNEMSRLVVEDDVWFVGHCLVTPIIARKRSMLMLGGLITQDMEENQVYAGSPAKNMTHVFGEQFSARSTAEKWKEFERLLREYQALGNAIDSFRIGTREGVTSPKDNFTYFDVVSRTYAPTYSDEETAFMRYLLYDKAKFTPVTT